MADPANRFGAPPWPQARKLPGECYTVRYEKEYGEDVFQMQKGSVPKGSGVVIVDDLLATGGSLQAAVDLVRSAGGEVLECITVIELRGLDGRKRVDAPCWSLLQY